MTTVIHYKGQIIAMKSIIRKQIKQSLGYNTNGKLYNTNGKYRIQIENYTIQMKNIEYKWKIIQKR
jgi:hypothetical protein